MKRIIRNEKTNAPNMNSASAPTNGYHRNNGQQQQKPKFFHNYYSPSPSPVFGPIFGSVIFNFEEYFPTKPPVVSNSNLPATISPQPPEVRELSECSTEDQDSFIVLANDSPVCSVQNQTASTPPTIKSHSGLLPFQQMSECSDDSFVICFQDESGNKEGNRLCNYGAAYRETSQPDSGFDEKKEKKVRFNLKPDVHVMHSWDFAYRAARKGPRKETARDRRCRFKQRIEKLGEIIGPILSDKHRMNIFNTRFCDNVTNEKNTKN